MSSGRAFHNVVAHYVVWMICTRIITSNGGAVDKCFIFSSGVTVPECSGYTGHGSGCGGRIHA